MVICVVLTKAQYAFVISIPSGATERLFQVYDFEQENYVEEERPFVFRECIRAPELRCIWVFPGYNTKEELIDDVEIPDIVEEFNEDRGRDTR